MPLPWLTPSAGGSTFPSRSRPCPGPAGPAPGLGLGAQVLLRSLAPPASLSTISHLNQPDGLFTFPVGQTQDLLNVQI